MNRDEAAKILGVSPNSSSDEVKKAYQAKRVELEGRFATAPTEGLRQKYGKALEEVKSAFDVISGKAVSQIPESDLSKSAIVDLPGAMPFFSHAGAAPQGGGGIGIKSGDVLLDRYEIGRQLGQGGMGAVYAAHDRNADQEIAIKVLLPAYLKDERARDRFLTEAKISRSLSHQNIVNVYDINKAGDLYFISMELLEGKTLRAEMQARKSEGKQFTIEEVSDWAGQLCDCLAYAHNYTVHRDIKPENIFIAKDGTVRLMDFGLARLKTASQLTRTGMAIGTAYYMAPEQLEGSREIDARADQYGLAVTLYELITGSVPVGRVKSAHFRRADCTKAFSDALDRAFESDPKDRFPTISDFKAALLSKGNPAFDRAAAIPQKPAEAPPVQRKSPVVMRTLGLIMLAVLGGVGYWLSSKGEKGGTLPPVALPTSIPTQVNEPTSAPVGVPTKSPAHTKTSVPPTATVESTLTASPSVTPEATSTTVPTATVRPSATVKPSVTARPSATVRPSATPQPSATPRPTFTPSAIPTATEIPPTRMPKPSNTPGLESEIIPTRRTIEATRVPERGPRASQAEEAAIMAQADARQIAGTWEAYADRNGRSKSAVAEQARSSLKAGDDAFAAGNFELAKRNFDKARALFAAALTERPRVPNQFNQQPGEPPARRDVPSRIPQRRDFPPPTRRDQPPARGPAENVPPPSIDRRGAEPVD